MDPFPLRALTLLLSAWTLGPVPADAREKRESPIPADQRAYMIGRYVLECEPRKDKCLHAFDSISLAYRGRSGSKLDGELVSTRTGWSAENLESDFMLPAQREVGTFFCRPLPAGSYEFYSYGYEYFAKGPPDFRVRKEDEFSLPFELAAGDVAYVGTLKLTTERRRTLIGLKVNAPGVLLLSSDAAGDVSSALQKCPADVRSRQVRTVQLDASMAPGSPLVRNGRIE